MSRWTRGVVACTTLLAATACSEAPVEIDDPEDLDAAGRAACRALVDALPDELADLSPHEIEPADALGAAWGDPPVELRCGVSMPEELNRYSACEEINGVGWFVPTDQFEHMDRDLTITTIGFEPAVGLRVPSAYRPPVDVLTQLAAPIKEHLRLVKPCV